MSDLTFPLLDALEIQTCLEELEIPCTILDITKPTSLRTMTIYELFINILLGPKALPMLDQQENLLQESLRLMTFYNKLVEVTICAGVDMVTLRDLLSPQPKRMRHILSALVNFCKFREAKMALFEKCSEDNENLVQTRTRQERKLGDLTDKVNSIRMARAEQQPQVLKLRGNTSSLTSDLRELKKSQIKLAEEMDILKLEKSKLNEKLTNNTFLVTNVKQDCARLQSRIVTDPAKLLQTIKDMKQSVKTDKQTFVQAERKSRELTSKLEAMTIVEQDLEQSKQLLIQAETQRTKKREALVAYSIQLDLVQKKQDLIKELENKEKQHERQIKLASDKLSRLFSHQTQRQDINVTRKQKLDLILAETQQEFDEISLLASKNQKTEDQLKQEFNEFESVAKEECEGLQKAYSKLVTDVNSYQRQLSAVMV